MHTTSIKLVLFSTIHVQDVPTFNRRIKKCVAPLSTRDPSGFYAIDILALSQGAGDSGVDATEAEVGFNWPSMFISSGRGSVGSRMFPVFPSRGTRITSPCSSIPQQAQELEDGK
jgi:hypothetical protein